jgi:hypothetical protein
MENFDRFQLAGLALILKNETKADVKRDLRELISVAGADVAEKARRERLLRHLESADTAHPLELAEYGLERAGVSASETSLPRSRTVSKERPRCREPKTSQVLASMNTFANISLRSLKKPSRADPRIGQFFPIRGPLGT